ncbi:hypothetical protein GCM10009623_05950 [Nocardioides aestuarii]|uniref:PQQ-binding-like beta-propeller repeat protein n=1 Tax=Nocardioides aestuarii TaxID=252231 RepID=A0ABW4TI72_9ACTN
MRAPGVALVATALLTVGCTGEGGSPAAGPSPSATTGGTPTASAPPAVELPDPLSLRRVDGTDIDAEPFADFAVAAGDGMWVSGVDPGAVRYDGRTGRVTARIRLDGAVEQALEQSGGRVWLPTSTPELVEADATTGEVLSRVRLPGRPIGEGGLGAVGDVAYVLVASRGPTIVVVSDGRVSDRIPAPRSAVAVRAGYGALWVPTGRDTVERYDLATGEWSTIESGPGPRFLDVGLGAVWVMDQGDGSVTRIDARTGEPEVLAAYSYPIRGGDLTTGAGAVWLRTDDSVLRLTRSGEVTHVLELPPGSGSVAATGDAVLITNHDHVVVHRVPLPLPR